VFPEISSQTDRHTQTDIHIAGEVTNMASSAYDDNTVGTVFSMICYGRPM